MTRRWILALSASLPLLGCPQSGTATAPTPPAPTPAGGQVQQQQQSPTSKPASRPAGHAQTQPAQPEGPKLSFAIEPQVTVSPRIDVKLERLAILPMTEENLANEPVSLKGIMEPRPDLYYAAVVLRVTVNGKPWSEIDDGTGLEKIGPFALELPEKIVNVSGTALSDMEQPDLAYLYRAITPPVTNAKRFAFRAIMNLEEGHTLLARFNDLDATALVKPKQSDGEDDKGEEDGK